MEVYQTEEEQVEAIKRWWKANGRSIVTTLIVVLAVVFSWRVWQDHQRTQMEGASSAFQEVLEAAEKLMNSQEVPAVDSIEVKSVDSLAATLLDEYGDTRYAMHGRLLLAKKAVMFEQYDDAERHLKDILRKKPELALEQLVRYRLAKVLMAKEAYSEAVSTLSVDGEGSFQAAYEELRGDLALRQGDVPAAKAYYQKALDLQSSVLEGGSQAGSGRPMLEMKLFDLQ